MIEDFEENKKSHTINKMRIEKTEDKSVINQLTKIKVISISDCFTKSVNSGI